MHLRGHPGRSLFLAVAACCCLQHDLTQPSPAWLLFQAVSIIRARWQVPKAGGVLPRPECAGLALTGSQPLGNWPCISNHRAEQNHRYPREKPQTPKTDHPPRDQRISQMHRGKTHSLAASTASCLWGPQGAPAPLLPRASGSAAGAERHGQEKYRALPVLPPSRGNSSFINAACS